MNYRYNGRKPEVCERIVDRAFNGSGVRDTNRVLEISRNTVMRRLKKIGTQPQVSQQAGAIDDVALVRTCYRPKFYRSFQRKSIRSSS
ncbi:MAG: IS1-like element transposase [Candidatus Symbiodolus clandestinus]